LGILPVEPFRARNEAADREPVRVGDVQETVMASVEKRVRNGRTTYQTRWRDDQDQQRKKSFAKKGDADRFAATVEADMARGTYIELSKITVAE
jgi:mevalonate pyrophosphate decarboxylase